MREVELLDAPAQCHAVGVGQADVFDALSMRRSYKDAWTIERISAHIDANSGTHFEPKLVELFHEILPRLLQIKAQWDVENDDTPEEAAQ